MPSITLIDELPFVSVVVHGNGETIALHRVLLDTGSGGTAFKTDDMEKIGIVPDGDDKPATMSGVGGDEYVLQKKIPAIEIGDMQVSQFVIQMGALDYGFDFDGIIGADFLLSVKAIIDFSSLEIRKG
ncbi:MAG: retroviral-like aspartic protease family protein [Chloroflexi bacterium]|nr:retroviral-like aspartic protease family protein [Chloroflexota bacterium]MCC6895543.1 clan AA aspartic protease [Anaerolineae bacterium]